MKKNYVIVFLIAFLFFTKASAQNYNNIVNFNFNGTPTNGIKIKTNLPFTPASQMPTINIQGYNYGTGQSIGLQIVYYIFSTNTNDPTTYYYPNASISSFGDYTPQVYLADENGLVVIFINDKPYFERFTVSAFALGRSADISSSYAGWTVADEALTGSHQILLPYQNAFSGTVNMPGTGIWNATGNVGIGTSNPGAFMLAVKGNVHAQQVNIDMTGWSDYVFNKSYSLPSLTEVKTYIDKNHHLPEIPSEDEVLKEGINIGEMNKLLVKKVEELTLYLIEKDNKDKDQSLQLKTQQEEIDRLKQQVSLLIKLSNKD